MAKKIPDKNKIERVKQTVLRCLDEARSNTNKTEVMGFILGQLSYAFALLDADNDDEMRIVFVASSVLDEVQPQERKKYLPVRAEQLPLKENVK